MGRFGGRIDARPLIIFGAFMFLGSMWQLSRLTLDSASGDMFWPLIFRGVGLGCLFVPLTEEDFRVDVSSTELRGR